MKNGNHAIISIDAGKTFDNIQLHCMLKTLNQTGREGAFYNTIKAKYQKPNVSIIPNGERLKFFH